MRRFRLMLTPEMLDEKGALAVQFNRRKSSKRPKAGKEVLLREFAERFDRTFLPVSELVLKK